MFADLQFRVEFYKDSFAFLVGPNTWELDECRLMTEKKTIEQEIQKLENGFKNLPEEIKYTIEMYHARLHVLQMEIVRRQCIDDVQHDQAYWDRDMEDTA